MFAVCKSDEIHFSNGLCPIDYGDLLIFSELAENELVVQLPEIGKEMHLYYRSEVRNADRHLVITWVNLIPKYSKTWDEIEALSKLLGDIPGVEKMIWQHVAEWLTHVPKDSFKIENVSADNIPAF